MRPVYCRDAESPLQDLSRAQRIAAHLADRDTNYHRVISQFCATKNPETTETAGNQEKLTYSTRFVHPPAADLSRIRYPWRSIVA
jgi:hypothetical protein